MLSERKSAEFQACSALWRLPVVNLQLSSPISTFESMVASQIQSYAGRSMLTVSLPGSSAVEYQLPSLFPDEVQLIRNVEERLQAAEYDTNRVLPIFWDTETTGYAGIGWWEPRTSRIVQLGALTDSTNGSLQFKRDVNPFPVAMSKGSSIATNLTTQQVWGNETCPQVCSYHYLTTCCVPHVSVYAYTVRTRKIHAAELRWRSSRQLVL